MECLNVWGFWCFWCLYVVALVFCFLVYMIELGFMFLYDFCVFFVCFYFAVGFIKLKWKRNKGKKTTNLSPFYIDLLFVFVACFNFEIKCLLLLPIIVVVAVVVLLS
jgi:hypothetical protein